MSGRDDFWWWFVGLVDGEGSFWIRVGKRKNRKSPSIEMGFSVQMSIKELPCLEYIQKELGFGRIYKDPKLPTAKFIVERKEDVNYPALTDGASWGVCRSLPALSPQAGSRSHYPLSFWTHGILSHTSPYGLSSLTAVGRYTLASSEYLNLTTHLPLRIPSLAEGVLQATR